MRGWNDRKEGKEGLVSLKKGSIEGVDGLGKRRAQRLGGQGENNAWMCHLFSLFCLFCFLLFLGTAGWLVKEQALEALCLVSL